MSTSVPVSCQIYALNRLLIGPYKQVCPNFRNVMYVMAMAQWPKSRTIPSEIYDIHFEVVEIVP